MKTNRRLLLTLFLIISTFASFGQNLDSLKLKDNEIPSDYTSSKEMKCKSIQAATFYDMTDVYASMIGTVKKKDFQSFEKKGDSGTILYFEYEKDFKGEGFLDGLLWGTPGKPTKAHPEEYLVKGNILIIWSFISESEIKKISKEKVKKKFK